MHPAEPVLGSATLDIAEFGSEIRGELAFGAVADGEAPLTGLDLADPRDDRGRSAGEDFPQPPCARVFTPLLEGIGFLANLEAAGPGERDDRGAGYSGEDGPAEGRCLDRPVLEDKEDVHPTEFFDPAPFDGVEENDLVATVSCGFSLGEEARGVVSAALGRSGAAGREAMTMNRCSEEGLTPRKASVAIMKGRR